jgi:parallel beta-helix repeat protein
MKHVGLLVIAMLFLYGTADATTWYVHPDSTLNSIQAALDSCADNDIVLVAPGFYIENITWPATQGIDLMSEYGPDTTIIDGDSAGIVITITTGVDSATVINGFTIQNGSAYAGGGIGCHNNSSPTITGNTITVNTATWGGGIYCNNSSPTIADNTITGNIGTFLAGGIECFNNSSPIITSNIITDNESFYAGGGIGCHNNSSPTITGNTITGNTAVHGGGIASRIASPTVTDNIITDNAADSLGGGIGFRQSSPTISHNIIEANTALCGGGIGCDSSSFGTIDSCTISGNNGDGIYCVYASSPVIHCCNISSNTGYGVRNIDPSVTVNADSNWWGDSTGPYHPSTNPGGLGDTVSDRVSFDPWLPDSVEWARRDSNLK